ncbi:MAG: complex I NDUFA9 subunit family protein [Alphaproteobacteria bacterium]|nr:complex I NDUFA9 subunit family protein [Alphaproteobacteria bacterium]
MANRRVTVFGGSGFIGRHLVRRLSAAGFLVRIAVRDTVAAEFLKPMGDIGQIVAQSATITDDASVTRAVEGADWVVNLVGILYERGANNFKAIHVDGAARVARAAKAAGARRLIHLSALGADKGSASVYARSKAQGEQEVLAAFPDATILRPSVVFGPEDDFFNRFAALTRISPVLPVFSDSLVRITGPSFQPVYVGDVAQAILTALTEPGHTGKIYELGGPRPYTMREIMELVSATIERPRRIVPIPFWLGKLEAAVLQFLPKPPLTPDQVVLLMSDNVLNGRFPGLAEMGITPEPVEAHLSSYLRRYRALFSHTILRPRQ